MLEYRRSSSARRLSAVCHSRASRWTSYASPGGFSETFCFQRHLAERPWHMSGVHPQMTNRSDYSSTIAPGGPLTERSKQSNPRDRRFLTWASKDVLIWKCMSRWATGKGMETSNKGNRCPPETDPTEMLSGLLCRMCIIFVSRGLKSHGWNSRQLVLIDVQCTFRERLERIYGLRITLHHC